MSGSVINVSFEGTDYPVTPGTETVIEGNNGTLTINSDGSYNYEANNNATGGGTTHCLNVTEADVAGTQSTLTQNGITVTSVNGGDLTFTDGGIGIFDGVGSNRVAGNDEALDVDFAPASEVILTMGDLGNNPGSAIDFTIHLSDGTTQTIEIPVADIPQVHDAGSVTFNAADFGADVTIVGVDVFSHDTNSNFGRTSFSLIDVKATEPGEEAEPDQFIYTIQDQDGDTDTAVLNINVESDPEPIEINGVGATDDTNLLDDGMDMITGAINVNFQGDGPGTTAGNGSFNSSGNQLAGNLTSNGVAVNVSFNANTNTYVGTAAGQTVFTMVINADGTYKFTQLENLDHSNTCLLYTSPSPRDS